MSNETDFIELHDDEDVPDIEDTQVEEETETQDLEENERFAVSTYGWDVDVEGLVKRMNRGDIHVPGFQRGFVWKGPEKSRFIESLILGLPIPTLFLARDSETSELNIIDGQQRLKTLQSYLNGEFALRGKEIAKDLQGLYYSTRRDKYLRARTLAPADERTLSDAVIHSIVIRPNPKHDDKNLGHEYNKAIIQIFKRLNTSGKALLPQEVRASIFHGELLKLIQEINKNEDWRALFGEVHSRMKDEEAITRAIALHLNGNKYKASMPKFLDDFMEENRHIENISYQDIRFRFESALKLIRESMGDNAFKSSGTFVLTVFDALVVGLMSVAQDQTFTTADEAIVAMRNKIGSRSIPDRLMALEQDKRGMDEHGQEISGMSDDQRGYVWSVAKFTNDTNRVSVRLRVAKEEFAKQGA